MPMMGRVVYLDYQELSRAGLQLAKEAHGQRFHRGFQWPFLAGVPERELVPFLGGRKGEGGILAKTL